MANKRGNVWIAVSGVVENENGDWLVVKKKYGGLKGKWSFPAGFVNEGETLDEAIVREIHEETGIETEVEGVIGIRSGVIQNTISDNMIIFKLKANSSAVIVQEDELYEAAFFPPQSLKGDENASLLLQSFAEEAFEKMLYKIEGLNPGDQFGYTSYRIFL
ncbi:NUDIX domain-containing protein [Metabacillus idriensis]|uniref:NUDIX domain-containing protein n=1 Tax=Metabacillus idriensis TaxID=324768 RepID=UPI002812A020|nr:NUDIX domain-containing protein [Metabacillus idriensis]MDR0139932.1 NUDIX domain-containing protein [Metabacillus idriensis]